MGVRAGALAVAFSGRLAGWPRGVVRRAAPWWTWLLVAAPTVALFVLGYRRRWICDDGLIYLRPVRQVLAGHGPVFNVGERAESSTGTLWQWLLTLLTWITGEDPAFLAVGSGLALSTAGYGLALWAACRLHGGLHAPAPRLLVPAGVWVLLAVPPFWSYMTSGLESGLDTCWTAVAWWLLVRTAALGRAPGAGGSRPRGREPYVTAFVLGLGWLVRPDLLVVTACFLAAQWWLLRPAPARTARLLGTAFLVPLAYEVFRAGYYGVLLPLPAIAKEAGAADWGRGARYVQETLGPYWIWPAAAAVGAVAVQRLRGVLRDRRRAAEAVAGTGVEAGAGESAGTGTGAGESAGTGTGAGTGTAAGTSAGTGTGAGTGTAAGTSAGTGASTRTGTGVGVRTASSPARVPASPLVVLLAPPAAGALLTLYVMRVGGDYMHARMILPALFLFLLPFLVVPATRLAGTVAGLLAVWLALAVSPLRQPFDLPGSAGTFNVRSSDVRYTHDHNPVRTATWVSHWPRLPHAEAMLTRAVHARRPTLLYFDDQRRLHAAPLPAGAPYHVVMVGRHLGVTGAAVPLDDYVNDAWGLASPVGAHLALERWAWPGHEKFLRNHWIFADWALPTASPADLRRAGVTRRDVSDAHAALHCGRLAELRASVRAPLTPSRFWQNLTGAYQRTRFRFARDPGQARAELCGRPS